MLGQAHTPRRRLLPLVAMALVVLIAPAVVGANPSHQSVATLRARDAAIESQSRAAVLGLYSLDHQLAAANTRLAGLQREQVQLRAERATLEIELRIARHGTTSAQRQLAERIRYLYEQGTVEPLEIVFGAKSLDDAVTSMDNLSSVGQQSEEILREFKAAKSHLAGASRELASRERALTTATSDAEATAAYLTRTHEQRTAYIASLASQRALTRQQIAAVEERAREAQIRSAQVAASAHAAAPVVENDVAPAPVEVAPAAAATAPATGGRTLTVTATGYALSGNTASGLPVGWGVVAVDPSVIPLGTHLTVPGYGEAVAADTGGAIVGDTIDLWFPTVEQADAWGRRTVTIVLH